MPQRAVGCVLLANRPALARIGENGVRELTKAATSVTFDHAGLTAEQRAANQRVVDISGATALAACDNSHQHFAAAFVSDRFAGFVIATRHAPNDLELDWLMVHPDFHGTDVASALMVNGIEWLGPQNAIWLNVIRHNARAIRFYRRFGFEIDPSATTNHIVPHVIMRRAPSEPIR